MQYPSSFLVGCDPTSEQRIAALIDDKPARFFALAQRIVWGTSQPELVRVDVRATLARLLALHPRLFVSHLLAAYATRASYPARADASLALARSLCEPDHPWRYLLPSDDEWSGKCAATRLHEVLPDQVWRVRADRQVPGTPFYCASHATVLRGAGRSLTLVNPVALSDASVEALRALGEVTTVVVQGRIEAALVARTRALFPAALVLGPARAAHHALDGALTTDTADLPRELSAIVLEGTLADEVVLLHRPSALLVTHELVSNNRSDNSGRSFAGRLEYFAFGLDDRLGVQSFHPLLWHDLRALQQGLARILSTPFAHVTGAHWPLTIGVGADDLRGAYAAALDELCSLTRAQHATMRLGYLWHQPAFLRDVLRSERARAA